MITATQTQFATATAAALGESDDTYFELAASVAPLDGAQVSYLPGTTGVPVGCVIHRVAPERAGAITPEWLADAERAVRNIGASLVRMYVDETTEASAHTLRAAGYVPAVESGLLLSREARDSAYSLQPVEADEGWRAFQRIAASSQTTPDGHANDPDLWTQAIRKKTEDGRLKTYLVLDGQTPVGSLSTLSCGSVLRMKNLVVVPELRRRGAATGGISAAIRRDLREAHQAIGVFALRAGAGSALYANVGFQQVLTRTEWSRATPGPTW